MAVLSSRRRWLVPTAVLAVVAAGVGGTVISASAEPKLPARSAAQLLVDLQTAKVDGLSGTIVQKTDIGLPSIPLPAGGGQGSSDLSSLISGSHTMRIWTSGPDKTRVALLGTLGESDVIVNNRDVWLWSSNQKTASHYTLPEDLTERDSAGKDSDRGTTHGGGLPEGMPGAGQAVPLTPQDAAQRALEAIDPTTAVATDGTAKVAGRSAYELVLTPKDSGTLVREVRLAVDADVHIPLRVQVMAKGKSDPAIEVGFTHLSLSRPDDQNFRFSPPPGTKTTEHAGMPHGTDGAPRDATERSDVIGSGWSQVFVIDGVSLSDLTDGLGGAAKPGRTDDEKSDGLGRGRDSGDGAQGSAVGSVLNSLPEVRGSFGTGRLLKSNLFTALFTQDGRLYVGAVGPDLVTQAANR